MEEDYEENECDDEEESGGLILSIGNDGKASIHKPEDYVELHKDDMEIIKSYIDKNHDDFFKFAEEFKAQKTTTSKKKSGLNKC